MDNVIEVSITSLEQDTNTMFEILNELKRKVQEIDEVIFSLNVAWDSEAKRTFMLSYEKEKQAFLTMFDNVEEVLLSMQHAKQVYESCENTVNQKIMAIRI